MAYVQRLGAGMATIMVPDLLAPTAEIKRLCVDVLPSLVDVRLLLQSVRAKSPF
jgi:hypothetical protein